MFRLLEKSIYFLSRAIGGIGILVLLGMVVIIVADVFLRAVLNSPIVGSTEIIQCLNVSLCFFALVWCTLLREHIKVDLLDRILPDKFKSRSEIVYYILGIGLFCVIFWQNFIITRTYLVKPVYTLVLKIPLFPFYLIIAVTCLLVVILLILHLVKGIAREIKHGS
jgi:TRAP-type transport system small permease protein